MERRWSIILASLAFVTWFHVSCFLVGGGPPHAQPKISKTTPCKVAERLLALDGFGDPAKAFDTSGKSAAPLHHRAVHMTRARNGDRRQTETGKLAAELRGLTFFDDLPEVRCQLAVVTGKHLIQVPLGPDRRLQSPLFTLGGFGFVLLCFRFKISHGGATPRNTRTTFDSSLA